jgi:hypothetical protein
VPEESDYTSIKARIEHCRQQGRMEELRSAMKKVVEGRTLSPQEASRLEEEHWLCPFGHHPSDQQQPRNRRGLLHGFSLAQYASLVDATSRLVRDGKANVSAQVSAMLVRLGTSAEVWKETLVGLFSKERQLGVAFAFSREHLEVAAAHRGCHHVANLNGCRA